MTWRNYLRVQNSEWEAWTFHGWVIEWLYGDARPECVRVLCWGWTSKNQLRITTELEVKKFDRPPQELLEMKPGVTTLIWETDE